MPRRCDLSNAHVYQVSEVDPSTNEVILQNPWGDGTSKPGEVRVPMDLFYGNNIVMTGVGAPDPVALRIRLAARRYVGESLVGCTGAKLDPATGAPHATLDIAVPGAEPFSVEVVTGEGFPMSGGTLEVTAIHPWNPPRTAGVELRWVLGVDAACRP